MTRELAREEARRREERAQQAAAWESSWFNLWGGYAKFVSDGRWGAEEKLVVQRRARVKDLLEEPVVPKPFWSSMTQFWNLGLT